MLPADPARPSLDPRRLAVPGRARELWHLLRRYGYVPQEGVFHDLLECLLSHRPWLIGGERGCGKSTLAEALAAACNLDCFHIVGHEGLGTEELLYRWDEAGQEAWMREARERCLPLAEAERERWSRRWLILGEVAGAYDQAAQARTPPLLFLDEVDKFGPRLEDKLLLPLASGLVSVPRLQPLGVVGCRERRRWPIVISASNDLRHELSGPFKSRHLYTWFESPTPQEEARILATHLPQAAPDLLAAVVKFMEGLRAVPGLADRPALREAVAFLEALHRNGATALTPECLERYLCYLARSREDRAQVRFNLDFLARYAHAPHEGLDAWAQQAVAEQRELSSAKTTSAGISE